MNPLFLVNQCYEKLPSTMKSRPWEATDHGKKVLQTEDELNAYVAAYGEMHITKCRAALQNFPFDKLKMQPFEVFDWGCGQGLATLTLLNMLQERNLQSQLKRIYLIEPSRIALQRACNWVKQYGGPGITITPINKCIPSSIDASMPEVQGSAPISINMFSNVLDINSLNLAWLANKTASLAPTNYMLCVGPKFPQNTNTRIDDFCGYFSPKEYFSKIDSYPYSYTSRTQHAYGCSTRCFVHMRSNALNDAYKEVADTIDIADPYDFSAKSICEVGSKSIIKFYDSLRQACESSYEVFFRPTINCDTVHFVLASKNKGIILINVCENLSKLDNEFRRIEGVKSNIFNIHLRTIRADSIATPGIYNCIKTALFFPTSSKDEVEKKIKELNRRKNDEIKDTLDDRDYIDYKDKDYYAYLYRFTNELNVKHTLSTIQLNNFKTEYYNELVNIIFTNWHSYKDADLNFRLSPKQKEIVKNDNLRLRVKGVAGCGKTQVVANRAVERHIKTGERVLIITFNISLIQYIRMRINQVPADFFPNMFEIINYHQFFKSKANQYSGRKIQVDDFDDARYFDAYRNKIQKYKTIIIDEVQDFKESWLQSIINNFLSEDGSVSLFGDGEQNIYGRQLDEDNKMPPIRECGFTGRWKEMNDRISMRLLNPQIAALSSVFAMSFIQDINSQIIAQGGIVFDEYYIRYWNTDKKTTADRLAKNIKWIINRYHIKQKDVVILGQSINLLRDIEAAYVCNPQCQTMINFETHTQYQQISRRYSSSRMQNILDEIRRAAKTHFTTNCDAVKFSTIHSFKGWESNTVILILQPEVSQNNNYKSYEIQANENTPALIYTALTRAKCNLFIINMGNLRYDNFFKSQIK